MRPRPHTRVDARAAGTNPCTDDPASISRPATGPEPAPATASPLGTPTAPAIPSPAGSRSRAATDAAGAAPGIAGRAVVLAGCAVAVLLLTAPVASAAPTLAEPALAGWGARSVALAQGVAEGPSLDAVLTNIRNWIMGLLALLATVYLSVGGVRYVLSAGEPGEVDAAKRCFRSAAFGYALAALAPVLVQILRGIVGA